MPTWCIDETCGYSYERELRVSTSMLGRIRAPPTSSGFLAPLSISTAFLAPPPASNENMSPVSKRARNFETMRVEMGRLGVDEKMFGLPTDKEEGGVEDGMRRIDESPHGAKLINRIRFFDGSDGGGGYLLGRGLEITIMSMRI